MSKYPSSYKLTDSFMPILIFMHYLAGHGISETFHLLEQNPGIIRMQYIDCVEGLMGHGFISIKGQTVTIHDYGRMALLEFMSELDIQMKVFTALGNQIDWKDLETKK